MDSVTAETFSLPFHNHFEMTDEEEEMNLYHTTLAYQIPGFYSDDDDNDEDRPCAPKAREVQHVPTSRPEPSFSVVRKRSMTNSFTAIPPHTSKVQPDLSHNQLVTASHARKPLKSFPVEPLKSKPTHLTCARKKLAISSRRKFFILGHQPIITTISPQEKRDCFQKIWIHQMNRSEAQQHVAPKFEVIPEEEGL